MWVGVRSVAQGTVQGVALGQGQGVSCVYTTAYGKVRRPLGEVPLPPGSGLGTYSGFEGRYGL